MEFFIIVLRDGHQCYHRYYGNPVTDLAQTIFYGLLLLICAGVISIIFLKWRQRRKQLFNEQLFLHSLAHPAYQEQSSTTLNPTIDSNFKINQISASQRCEICHQIDLYDPVADYCLRCAKTVIKNITTAEPLMILTVRSNPQLQLSRRLIVTFLLCNGIGSPMVWLFICAYTQTPLPWFFGLATGFLFWLFCWLFFFGLNHLDIKGLFNQLELYCFTSMLEVRGNPNIKLDFAQVKEIQLKINWLQRRLKLGTIKIKIGNWPMGFNTVRIRDIERADEVYQHLMILWKRARV